jgi:polyisoprenoid-binding protein YceI
MPRFNLDPDHTSAEFNVRHMMVTWVAGQFSRVRGELRFDPLDVAASSVEAEIEVASLRTGVERRDKDLLSPNYFEVDRYPTIAFRSTRVEVEGFNDCLVYGELTIKGVTRPVTLEVRFAGPARFQDDDRLYTTYGFQAKTLVNREDFGLMTNLEIENRGFMVGKHAHLTINAEADLIEE